METMQASDELSDVDARQLLFELENLYANFFRALEKE